MRTFLRWATRLFICMLMLTSGAARAEKVSISMMYSNAANGALPFELFTKGKWAPDANARFVKLHLYFNHPVTISAFELSPCSSSLKEEFTVFANFDEWLWHVDSADNYTKPREYRSSDNENGEQKGRPIKLRLNDGEIRSLTFNFGNNKGFALCGLKFFDQKSKVFEIAVPKIVDGLAVASSTLEPSASYDVMNLFDSRFESAWASNKEANNVSLNFDFEQNQTISKLRIWSGYQRSPEHCIANSRPKILRVEGEQGYLVKVPVQDILGAQEINLPKPYTGKSLKLTVEQSYRGKTYPDLVVSELRFGNLDGWFMLDPLPHSRQLAQANREIFKQARLQAVLDDGLEMKRQSDKPNESEKSSTLRLRSDGSVYFSQYELINDDIESSPTRFLLGNYEIKGQDPVKGVKLRLFGLYHEAQFEGDCNGCGRDCNRPTGATEKIIEIVAWLRAVGKNHFLLEPIAGKKLLKATIHYQVANSDQM